MAHSCRREPAPLSAGLRSTKLLTLTRAPRNRRAVELRYFGGLSVEETAEVLKVHPNTVVNDWREAKAWLYCMLNEAS